SLDERSDIYSLGAILYELLTLQPPFGTKGDVRTVLAQVVNEPVLSPEKIIRHLPRELVAITLKALEKEKENRYPSVAAMIKDVQCFLEGKEVSALPDSLGRKLRRKAHRHATALKWMTLSFVLLLVSLTVLWNQYHRSVIQDYLKAGDALSQKIETWEAGLPKQTTDLYKKMDQQTLLSNKYREILEAYRKVLDFDFHHLQARQKLAEISFKLWKIGLTQKNDQLVYSSRYDLQDYLGTAYAGSDFEKKIEGRQNFTLQTQPKTKVYLFRYLEKDRYLNPTPYTNPKALSQNPIETKEVIENSFYELSLALESLWGETDATGKLILADLEPGSYLAILKNPDFLILRVPVWIQHPELQPKPLEPLVVGMIPKTQAVPGFTYIPQMRFLSGGESSAGAGAQLWKKTKDGFFLKTEEVPLVEYTEFLEHLCESEKFEEAEQRIPRSFKWKLLEIHKDQEGKPQKTDKGKFLKYNPKLIPAPLFSCAWNENFSQDLKQGKIPSPLKEMLVEKNKKPLEDSTKITSLTETSWKLVEKNISLGLEYDSKLSILKVFELQTWNAWKNWKSLPLGGISYLDTQAYIAWISQRDQKPYRLPNEEEWELAARGVDGRKYSWGNHFHPEFARLTQGYGGMSWSELENKDENKTKDESPFGVHHLAGSVAEWVEGFFDPESAKSANQEKEREVLHIIRGNAWGLTPIGLECAFRTNGPQDYFHLTIGFRYCFTYQP
ncbi:MAG: SUMF1/EgtB/PvdO family nonheme iron enzyme, partial [Planctomycetota bacterium]